jgi:hypothetical protein
MSRNPQTSAGDGLFRSPPAVHVESDEHTVDVRLWARGYVRLLLELEGVVPISATLPRAS